MLPFKTKRLLLIIPFSTLATIWYKNLRNIYILTPIIVISCIFIFYNFPIFVKLDHTKPNWLENLNNEFENDELLRQKYEKRFIKIMIIIGSLLIGFLFYYWYKKFEGKSWHIMDFITSTFVMYKIYIKIKKTIGKYLLKILLKYQNTEIQHRISIRKNSLTDNPIV